VDPPLGGPHESRCSYYDGQRGNGLSWHAKLLLQYNLKLDVCLFFDFLRRNSAKQGSTKELHVQWVGVKKQDGAETNPLSSVGFDTDNTDAGKETSVSQIDEG
jgi:hypothetical protein